MSFQLVACRRVRHQLQLYRPTQQLHLQLHYANRYLTHTHTNGIIHRSIRSLSSVPTSTPAPSNIDGDGVTIGDVTVPLARRTTLSRPDLIPKGYLAPQLTSDSQETLQHLKWMMQKVGIGTKAPTRQSSQFASYDITSLHKTTHQLFLYSILQYFLFCPSFQYLLHQDMFLLGPPGKKHQHLECDKTVCCPQM